MLSDFGDSLSINETTSDDEDGGGETGAIIFNDSLVRAVGSTGRWGPGSFEGGAGTAGVSRATVLRLAIEGSKRTSGILASNYAQPQDAQEIISVGDEGGMPIKLGAADRYLIRGFSWVADGTNAGSVMYNEFDLHSGWTTETSGVSTGQITDAGTRWFSLRPDRRHGPGIGVWTAPQGATVPGNRRYMVYEKIDTRPPGTVLTRTHGTTSDHDDAPTAPGVSLFDSIGDFVGRPLQAFLGEPLVAMVQNLGQTDNSGVSLGGILANKVLSQGFTTGSDAFGYRLQGIGVNIEGSSNNFPDGSASVSVAVHADSGGKPGDKLFDLLSPTEYAAGHSFFEAPPGTYLDPNTAYVLVWRYISGTTHRLQRTAVDAEDAGARSGAGIANAYYLGAAADNLTVDSGGNALEVAVYTEVLDTAPGEFVLVVDLPTEALVSNIGQSSVSGGYDVDDTIRYAPSFNTGSKAVTLDSVELNVETAPTNTSDISVAIHVQNPSSNPGSKLYDLSNPSTIGTGVQTFTAPLSAALEANTTYSVVVSSTSSTDTQLSITNSDSEDAGGADGWTIDNSMDFFRGSSWSNDNSVVQIRVNGYFSVTTAPTALEPDWALVPEEVSADGGVFRLLFLSSTARSATSTDIETYNTRVQTAAAAGHAAIRDYSAGFRAVASTAAVDARDNTATTGTSVPIYWLGGTRLADNYADFYDGTWDDEQNVSDESGLAYIGLGNPQAVWTGGNDSGVEHFHSGVSRALGASTVERGGINHPVRGVATPNPLYGNNASANTDSLPLYALSEVFTVGPNPARITDLAITSNPRSGGIYRTGETIEVTATFGAPVRVEGAPRIKLRLGLTEQRDRWAEAEGVQVVDLVKNTGQPTTNLHIDDLTSTTIKRAQAFTTGDNANGYTLSSIGIKFGRIAETSTAGSHLVATLNAYDNDTDSPGASLCTLGDPASFSDSGVQTFVASARCPTLAASTNYFVVIERVQDNGQSITLAIALGHNEDTGGAAGWSVANWRRHLESGASWPFTGTVPLQIEVRGHALPTAGVLVPGQERVLVDNFVANPTGGAEVLDSTTTKAAQAFTTGVHSDGSRLSSITLLMQLENTATAGDHLTVTLNADSSGNPGNVLCTLDDAAVFFSLGRTTFDAPTTNPCPTLAANTTYFVVVERVDVTTTDARWLLRLRGVDETGDSTAGWSIGDSSHSFASGSWSETDNEPYGITVNSVAFLRASEQAVFSYTVQAADESDTDGIAVGLTAASNAVDLNGGAIKLGGTERSAVLGFAPLDSDDGHLVNWARPSLVDGVSAVDGRRLHLTFSEELNPDSTPSTDLFTVYLDGDPAVLRVATAAVAGRVVTLRLETALSSPVQALTVSYADPSAGDDRNAVEDREGNDAFAFDNRPLTNRFGLKAELLPDSPLIPEGLGIGAQFRLLFLTSTTRDARSTEIEDYNAFVQAAAAIGRADIREYGTGFFAVASTAAAAARDNTATTGTGVPIYWLGGNKLADNNADFYDGSWDDEANPTDESGAATGASAAWTGSGPDGTKGVHTDHGSTVLGGGARAHAAYGMLDSGDYAPLSGQTGWREISRPFYALSEVFTVVSPAAVSSVAISSDPGSDGNYATGDEIAVAFTFGEEVDVTGNPRIRIRLGDDASTERTAYFDRAVLVKNTAQTPFSGSPLNAATPKFAQRFSTGAIPGGYQLSEIGIRFHTIDDPASADGQLTVTVNRDNNGEPGPVRCTLTNPASLRSNVLSNFDATACGTLPVETDYYVVIERTTVSDDTIAVWTTASDDEDASRLEDWSIGDGGHVYRTSRGSWNASGAPFVIKVGGELTDPDIYQPRVLISNTGQTVQGEFSPVEGQTRFAALFTTGRSRLGYRLSSMGFRMGEITDPSTVGEDIRITLNSSVLFLPGYEFCTLSPPDSFTENAVNRFGASNCPVLAPNTVYFVRFERVNFDASERIEFSTTGSLSYDVAAAGWSYFQNTYAYGVIAQGIVGWDQTEPNTAYRVEISGRPLLPAEQPEPPAPPAQSQRQVANTGLSGLVGSALTSGQTKHAQAFTTGSHPSGYWLDSVRIGYRSVSNSGDASLSLVVALHEGGGADPGERVCRFDDSVRPIQNSNRAYQQISECPTLEPNTTYFIVVERTTFTSGNTIELSIIGSNGEDSGSRPGWSIADDSRVFGTAWSSGGGSSLAIDVRAVDIPSEEELRPSGPVGGLAPGPVGKLVSNHGMVDEQLFILGAELAKLAQAFTTGPNADGYSLSSLGFALYDFGDIESFKDAVIVTVKTNNGGEPGETLCTLGAAQHFLIGAESMVRFYPPATNSCPALEPNTTYFGVMEDVPDDTSTSDAPAKVSGAEDDDSAPGWSIGDVIHRVVAGGTQWGSSDLNQHETAWGFEVRGSAIAPRPLVRNTGQTALGNGLTFVTTTPKHAQAFTTGDNASGYPLRSIEIRFHTLSMPLTAGAALVVTVNANDNGDPGAALCTLIDPPSFRPSGSHKFAAPRCPALAANTTYFVVIESLDTVATRSLSVTSSGDEDSAAAGWSVADHGRRLERGTWTRVSTGSLMIAVNGDIAPLPSAPVVFSYTVAPADESNPAGVAVGDPGSDGNTIALGGGTITIRRSGETFPLDFTALFADAEHLVNWARPTLVSAATSKDGKRVRLSFSEDLGRSGRPPTSLFTLKVDGAEAALTGIGIDAAVVDSETWTVDAPLGAPQSWAFTPSGLSPGDQFRLLFVTSTKRDATSDDIDDYNTFVQTAAAAGDGSIRDYSHGFYAVGSTADDDARDNTKTTGTGVPIYWLGGNKLADDNADFYDGTWDDETNATDESGSAYDDGGAAVFVWTGTDDDGTVVVNPSPMGGGPRGLGVRGSGAAVGQVNSRNDPAMDATAPNPLYIGAEVATSSLGPLYALSLPFVVTAAAVEPPSADETQLVGSVVTLELVTPLTSSAQVVTVSYDDPRLGDDSNVIEDLVGNDARSFTNRPVLNRFAFAPPAVEVPADWPLVPEGLPAGAPFRLLFVTSTERDATSAYIEDYDDFVQNAAAAGHESIREYRTGFLALASTAETDARDNTSTTGTGVPIYWLGGAKLADNYADFYDESWDDEVSARDESGGRRSVSAPADAPWTGSNHNGTEAIVNADSRGLGGATGTAAIGAPGNVSPGIGPLNGGAESRSEERPLYALSQVFVVEPLAVPTGSAIIPDGLSDGDQFRLLFLTSTTSDALSSEIDEYNSFAQTAAAAGVAGIQAFAGEFRAVVSTADTDARDNTWTTGEGVPIYWLGGARLAGDYADFYDGTWDAETGATDETGSPRGIAGDADSPWTGSNHDGTEEVSSNGSHGLGGGASTGAVVGQLNAEVPGDGPLDADLKPSSESRPLYGLSPVLVVRDILDAPPAAPTGLTATPGDEQALLRWTRPASDGGRAITRYEYEQDGSGIWISTGGTATSYLVIGLNNRQSYTFRVRAANSIGSGAATGPSERVTPAKAPDAPTGLRADPGDRQVELTWTAPASDGGSMITGYEYEQDDSGIWNSTQSTDLRHTVTGLVNGQSYRFRVRALNDVGEGAESAASASVAPATQADVPTGLSALAGDEYVDLDWTAPESDGGAPITHYEYQQDFGAWTSTGSADTNYRVPNLTNGQTYTFRVRARNRLPDASAESNVASVTPTAEPMPPDAPSDLVARPGHESVRLSWNQTGAIVTDYEYELDGSGDWIATGSTDKSYTVRRLNNRQLYRFKVRGVNDDGNGPASAEAQATPNAQPPDPPTDLKAVAGDGQVTLTWTAPKSDGGTAITHYQYEQNGNWHSTVPRDSTDTTYTVTGLTNQRTYRFRVQAFNESQAGPSTPSKVAEARPTGPTPPDAPTGLSAVAGDGRVELSWTAPESDGGFRITGYEYEKNGSGDWVPTRGTAASRTLRGLENGREYTFRVRAVNRLGSGAASDPSQPVTPARAPDAPTMLVAVAGDEQVELTWTAPASDGGSVITGYQYEQGDGNWISTQSTDITHTVTYLVNGRSHTFRVRSINRLGPGAVSRQSDRVTPARAPDPPTGLRALAGDGSVELDWTAPESDGGLRIIRYEYEQDGSGDWMPTRSAAASYRVPNLTNDQNYSFRVRAVNGLGASAESDFADATPTETLVAPDPPANLQAEAGHKSVRLSWDQTGAIVTRYEYELDGSDDWISTGGKSKTYTVTGLTNDQSYTFRVRAVNSAGAGEASVSRSARPAPTRPDAPSMLEAEAGNGRVTLTWTAPVSDGGRPITHYEFEQDGVWETTESKDTRYTVTGLTNGQTYAFRVQAANGVGASRPSNYVMATPMAASGSGDSGSGGGGSSGGGGGGGGGGYGPAPTAPKFVDGFRTTRIVAQNARTGDAVGDPVAATHPDDLVITYTLSGADAALFTVDGDTGQIRVRDAVEFELEQTFTVDLTATDSAGFGAVIIVVIEVGESLYHRYDLNRNGVIEKNEVLRAIADYFGGRIEKPLVLEVVSLYFAG